MNEAQKAAGEAALDAWAAPLIAQASIFTKSSYQGFISQHRDELVAAIGEAVLSVPAPVADPGPEVVQTAQPDAPTADTGTAT
jgi:hypothetical protein